MLVLFAAGVVEGRPASPDGVLVRELVLLDVTSCFVGDLLGDCSVSAPTAHP